MDSNEFKLKVSRLAKHDTLNGNGGDVFYYQFATSHALKGMPTLYLQEVIEDAINAALADAGINNGTIA